MKRLPKASVECDSQCSRTDSLVAEVRRLRQLSDERGRAIEEALRRCNESDVSQILLEAP
jgi:hypothetical protein